MSLFQNYRNNRNVCLKNLLGVLSEKLTSFFEGREFSATPQVFFSACISELIQLCFIDRLRQHFQNYSFGRGSTVIGFYCNIHRYIKDLFSTVKFTMYIYKSFSYICISGFFKVIKYPFTLVSTNYSKSATVF